MQSRRPVGLRVGLEEEPVASLRAVHTAAGRLDMMWRDDEDCTVSCTAATLDHIGCRSVQTESLLEHSVMMMAWLLRELQRLSGLL